MIQIDIEMPEKCGLCPLFHAEHPMHCQCVKADRKKKIVAPYEQPRPDWCPLHEVTDPDTVSRQAVLDAVEKGHAQCCRQDSTGDEWVHYDTIRNEMECLPPSPTVQPDPDTVSIPQWIQCSKKLPKIGVRVIGTYKNSLFENGPYVVRIMRREKKYWVGDDEHWFLYGNIFAWQPLPEPYKVEQQQVTLTEYLESAKEGGAV